MRTAYKGFEFKDWKLFCSPELNIIKFYKVGEITEAEGPLVLCKNGIHFCWNLIDVNNYYNFCWNLHDNLHDVNNYYNFCWNLHDSSSCVICKIEVLGDVINSNDNKKSCTNKIKVLEILTKEQIYALTNIGKNNK